MQNTSAGRQRLTPKLAARKHKHAFIIGIDRVEVYKLLAEEPFCILCLSVISLFTTHTL